MMRHGRLLGTPGSPVAFETEQARIQGEGTQGPSPPPPRPVFLSTLRLPSSQLVTPFGREIATIVPTKSAASADNFLITQHCP